MSFDEQYKKEKCLWGLKPIPIVKSLLKYKSFGKVLDLEAGEGRNSIFLAENGFDVTAVDISEPGIKKLKDIASKKNIKINTLVGDIRKFNFDKNYDVIVSIATLHFLKKADIIELIDKMKKHTNEEGLNAINVFTENNDEKGFPYLFKKDELKEFYNDWEILNYKEFIGMPEKHGDSDWHKHCVAVIVARK